MIRKKDSDEARERRAALLERKILQAAEGRAAMADYQRSSQATVDLTAKLKLERLLRQAVPAAVISKKPKRKAKPT